MCVCAQVEFPTGTGRLAAMRQIPLLVELGVRTTHVNAHGESVLRHA